MLVPFESWKKIVKSLLGRDNFAKAAETRRVFTLGTHLLNFIIINFEVYLNRTWTSLNSSISPLLSFVFFVFVFAK